LAFNIGSSSAPAISGQMGHIVYALDGLHHYANAPPLSQRIDKNLLGQGFDNRELPSGRTFDAEGSSDPLT
jgi:hypothetical protein